MKATNRTKQDTAELPGCCHSRFSKVASLGLAAIIGTLFTGCASNAELRSAAMPSIKPIFIVHGSETADSYYTLGKYYFWQNRFDQAQAAFQRALQLQPDNVNALNGLGAVYDRLGQFEAAQRSYRRALDKTPAAAYLWANLGYSMLLQGRAVTAAAVLEKAVNLDPADTMAQHHLALATEAAAKLAADSPANGQTLPVVASTAHRAAESAGAATKSKPEILTEHAKPAAASANSIVATIIPHEYVKLSNVIQGIVALRHSRPDAVQAKQNTTALASHAETLTRPSAMLVPTAQASANAPLRSPTVVPVSMESPVYSFSHTRVEISNGNGVNGMARALRTVIKSEGVNVTRVTNALPFNKSRTVVFCADEMKATATALARLLPGNPSVTIASTAKRNVEIRVVLGADAALAWNNSKKVNVAALY